MAMASRALDFPIFDADNHMYETTDAFTKFLPKEYDGLIRYVEVDGRTKIAVNGLISNYIPNPTFEVVAAPGAQEDYFKNGNPEGKSRREIMGKPIRSLPGFMAPEPRIKLMDELGIDRALMWPTLASLLEERLRGDPMAIHAVVHALNQWMHEHWTFNYEDRIFPTPVINLGIVDRGHRGARVGARAGGEDRPHPAGTGLRLSRAPFLRTPRVRPLLEDGRPRPDPCRHARLGQRLPALLRRVGRNRHGEMLPFKGGSGFAAIVGHQGRPIMDTVASLIGHGLCSRFPDLRFAPVENGSNWVRPILEHMAAAYHAAPRAFDEDPVEVFKRNIYVHPFHEEDPIGLIESAGRRPSAVRVGLSPSRGDGRPAELRRRARRPPRRRRCARSWVATSTT